jgi:hypothetical protein
MKKKYIIRISNATNCEQEVRTKNEELEVNESQVRNYEFRKRKSI